MIEIKGAEKYIEFRSMPASQTPGRGWVLVALYSDDSPYTTGVSYWDSQKNAQISPPAIPLTHTYALYGRTRDDVLMDLEEANQKARGERDEATSALKAAQKLLADAQGAIEVNKAASAHAAELQKATSTLLTGAKTSLHAMEADLGKVRDAVGGDRFKEILGRSTVKS